MVLVLGAILASWLGPIAVARYQRAVAIRDDTARVLDTLVGTRAELEAAVDHYLQAQGDYWQLRRDLQKTVARATVSQLSGETDPQLVAEEEGQKDAVDDAAEELKQAKQLFNTRADKYHITRSNNLFRLEVLFPQCQRQVRAAFRESDDDLSRAKRRFAKRDLGFRVTEIMQGSIVHELVKRAKKKELTPQNFERELQDVVVKLKDPAPDYRPFLALTNIVRILSHETPSADATILSANGR